MTKHNAISNFLFRVKTAIIKKTEKRCNVDFTSFMRTHNQDLLMVELLQVQGLPYTEENWLKVYHQTEELRIIGKVNGMYEKINNQTEGGYDFISFKL